VGLYRRLGYFSDLVAFAKDQAALLATDDLAELTPAEVRNVLGFSGDSPPIDVALEDTWTTGELVGESLSWSVGYGPRTRAWLLRPAHASAPLPGVLALHDHGGFKFLGREKIADGPEGPDEAVLEFRHQFYDGRAFANELARRGFAVLVHDAFLWGSRRFEIGLMQEEVGDDLPEPWTAPDALSASTPASVAEYNRLAARHEHVVAKYCAVLGTSLAGIVAYEDRVALEYLRSRPEVSGESLGCIGLSGGGCRSALLNAVSPHIGAAVVVGMMTTYEGLLDRHIGSHTWMFFPPGLGPRRDWPELASCRAPTPLMVLYTRGDQLFSLKGMQDAHEQIAARYASSGHRQAYVGTFYDGGHKFDREMQEAAFDFLASRLRPSGDQPGVRA